MEPESEWVTVAEASRLTSLSPKTIRRAIANGRITGWRHGTALRIRRDDLEDLFRPVPSAGSSYN